MRVFVISLMLLAMIGTVFAAPVTNSSPKDQPVVVDKQNTTSTPANPVAKAEPAPFPDVPKNHWAYEAVRQLQKAGILVGYPKGTFDGKQTMTRNDFAVAISRMLPVICRQSNSLQVTRQQVDDLERRISALEKGEVAPPVKTKAPVQPEICTKADCDSVQKLVTEFSGELKKMRVDVDALKKEVAALNDRVTVLKKNKFP